MHKSLASRPLLYSSNYIDNQKPSHTCNLNDYSFVLREIPRAMRQQQQSDTQRLEVAQTFNTLTNESSKTDDKS
jgi:hypothetical protein